MRKDILPSLAIQTCKVKKKRVGDMHYMRFDAKRI